jgi:hypothetical protein
VTPCSKTHSKAAPLAVLILVTLSLLGCSTSSAIRSDSSPSFAAVEAALAQTGVHSCNIRFSSGGTYCDRHTGDPSEATVYTDTPASFFSNEVSVAKALYNSVWANGRTIVAVPSPNQTLVTALDRNGFKRYRRT